MVRLVDAYGGSGSGTLIDGNGNILTNYHVIAGFSSVEVYLGDRYVGAASVVGYHDLLDLAIVQINTGRSSLTPIPISRSEPMSGDEIITIGYPLGMSGESTVTVGVVSAFRNVDGQRYLQTDAAINPGNSGGAALDRHGNLVGVPTWMYMVENIGFLIPLREMANTIEQLKRGSRTVALPPTPTPRPTPTPWPTPTPSPSAYDHFLQADFYYDTGQYYLALSEYNLAIILSPVQYASYFNNRGNVYYMLGLYSEAVDDYTQAVQISGGTNAIFYKNRSNAWFYLGMYTQMNSDGDAACRLDPTYC